MRKNKRGRREERRKNRRKRKRVKPDWECLPRVVLVTLNYKWSLTFQAKTHNHNIIPMMHFHWQATLLSPGLALATNLCLLLSFSSIPPSPSFQSPEWRILQTLPSFALSIFPALVSESMYCVTASCNLLRNSPLPLFYTPPPSIPFSRSVKRKIFHPPSPNSFHAQLSQFLLRLFTFCSRYTAAAAAFILIICFWVFFGLSLLTPHSVLDDQRPLSLTCRVRDQEEHRMNQLSSPEVTTFGCSETMMTRDFICKFWAV